MTDTSNINLKKDDIIEITIEKLTYGGLAMGHYNGFVVFVQNACPKDIVKAKIISVNKHYAKAIIKEIIKESENRIKPHCPLFNACGACQWQFMDYNFLLEEKRNILSETLQCDIPINKVIESPNKKEYRCKIQYPVSETKNSKRLLIGYYKERTHEITNIKFCPAQGEMADRITDFIRNNWSLGGYIEKTKKGLLRHVIIKQSQSKEEILLILVLNTNTKPEISDFISKITNEFKNIKGIIINYNQSNTNKILSDKSELIWGQNFYFEELGDKKFKIGAESFFQVNPKCAERLFLEVKKLIKPNSTLLDCYGGVGTIGSFTSDLTESTTLIEISKEACTLASENYKINNVSNFEILCGDVKSILNNEKHFDYSVIDPPRAGCDIEVLNTLSKISDKIIYVSCNPQTLRRDIQILQKLNFELKYVQPLDMFPYTYHLETICLLEKK